MLGHLVGYRATHSSNASGSDSGFTECPSLSYVGHHQGGYSLALICRHNFAMCQPLLGENVVPPKQRITTSSPQRSIGSNCVFNFKTSFLHLPSQCDGVRYTYPTRQNAQTP
ncbi:hypothetical protein DPMN_005199 [Dreissena polymorpha]|uniref:Uncharacterized protein n=1 Tax=Dreissena polymorpha TaxID=45954 RepID=A0A9D4MT15_DREPO|nr:hypothetical protein DPMN_005199 [Dreissena polymorpha]